MTDQAEKSGAEAVSDIARSFDHQSKDIMRDPYDLYKRLRSECPVAHTDAHHGFWLLSTYEDVFSAALDYETFSSADGTGIPKHPGNIFPMYPIDIDPPDQVLFRKVLNPKFEGKHVRSLEKTIQSETDRLIDAFIEDGHCDIANQLCRELPPVIALNLLGVPASETQAMREYIFTLTNRRTIDPEGAGKAGELIAANLLGLISSRRNQPEKDDIIGALLNMEWNGEKLNDEQIFKTVIIILFGGLDTSTAVMIQALYWLAEHPGQRQRLIDNPGLWDTAVEEFIRHTSPVQGLKRQLARETTLHGVTMKKGEDAFLLWGSANRDEKVFPEPEKCILDRTPNKHVSFGAGAHKCIGLHFGRSMVRILLQSVLKRLPDYRVDDGFEPDYEVGETRGIISLPITFTPGTKPG